MKCPDCGGELHIGDFPICHGDPTKHARGVNSVIGDEIPGGQLQENGFSTPQVFYSKADRRRALAAKGLEERVRHVTLPGTDKAPHTTDWGRGTVNLEAARALVERQGRGTAQPNPDDVPIRWQVTERPTE